MTPRFGKIPTPRQVLNAGLDSAAEVLQLPARLGSNLSMAGQRAADRVRVAIDKPKNYSDAPAPRSVVVEGVWLRP